jgi:IS30 family transposase
MRSISERPQSINERKNFGHWERDTAQVANRKYLLVATERRSRLVRVAKLAARDTRSVFRATHRLEKSEPRPVLSWTNDLGSEFREGFRHPVPVFYCRPFKPQQRGTVENTIGLLRQFIGRKTDVEAISAKHLKAIEQLINHRPRKCLGFKTPYEVYYRRSVALTVGI